MCKSNDSVVLLILLMTKSNNSSQLLFVYSPRDGAADYEKFGIVTQVIEKMPRI